ncbi:KGGVGR-motif variant AAA ATPase [Streptomyces cacaoi]|uniref:CobQ/CobB/MinD/ParA nucleotide binding domain-containing protein n=1 Tax=Streptomyces cacaoi TaxID=1898 RepID=A0A4Y3R547_STRCI|nr:AAA family ATPase [Streptomyces cacaoi]NNG84544.1 AAA family ATPase [Streptomyces cacaoi]GEB52674.1 hypothetical protein SCA03_52250 [Streptomyces cacaoi]
MAIEGTLGRELAPPEHLFTWVDVDEHLADLAASDAWPAWLLAADGWWDGLQLTVAKNTSWQHVRSWLDEVFGPGSVEAREGLLELALDSPRDKGFTGLPVSLDYMEGRPQYPTRLPRLREKQITAALSDPLPRPEQSSYPADVQMLAFHSFKGGVGRTVHAVAMADAAARRGDQVLLIDADLEAPGISWMHQAQGGQFDFSYEDFLALLQGADEGDWSSAVEVAAAYLPNQQAGHYPDGGSITIVPASRRRSLSPPRIEPADLLSSVRSPYFLTEAIAALASRVGAGTVVIDLRAGATELAAPVLLDPRVQRIFVTTLSHQSVAGTEKMMRQLGHRAPTLQSIDPASSVIITQYREEVHESQIARAESDLSAALMAMLAADNESHSDSEEEAGESGTYGVDTGLLAQPVYSKFREDLLALPSAWDSVLRVLTKCDVAEVLDPIMPPTIASVEVPDVAEPTAVSYTELRERLAEVAKGLIYAERQGLSSASGFLVTDPLRRLLSDHRTEPPLSLVVGAKGAGKTFLYAKACAARTWDRFAEQSQVSGVMGNVPIVPVLESGNLEYADLTTQDLRDDFAGEYGNGREAAASAQELRGKLQVALSRVAGTDEISWRNLWLECLAEAAGLRISAEGGNAEEVLAELGRRARAVFVIDGLEDLLQTLDSEVKRTALRVLLTDVLGWLRSLRGRPLGLVIFVRQDLVKRAVQQNSGQLLHRYDPYALRWNKDEALRLALWVAARAEALPTSPPAREITELNPEQLVDWLKILWGWKMGTEKSKEARCHLWVPAALGDFRDQVQARDVVVFLSEAASLSVPQTSWDDRVLVPSAMRKALKECSRNKIDAIQDENQEVGDLLEKLQQVRHPVTVPFELEEVGLTVENADFLVESGVFARGKDGRYWVAEIYRHGLGYGSERRAKVLWRR